MQENQQQILSEEEWIKILRVCDNNCEHAAAHILAAAAWGVKHRLFNLMKQVENGENTEISQEDTELIRERISAPYRMEIENFADSGKNAAISVDFVADNQEQPASQERRRIDLDLEKADDADLPYGLSKEELANLLHALDMVVVKPEFQQVRRIEVGTTATPTDKNGMPLGKTETFHCAIFDANKFELVRKSEVGLSERHLGGKKPVFH